MNALVDSVFTHSDDQSLSEIQIALQALHERDPKYMYTANRTAKISFRGETFSLVDGSAGYYIWAQTGPRWKFESYIFVIAPASLAGWIRVNADIFNSAYSDDAWCIACVDLQKILSGGWQRA